MRIDAEILQKGLVKKLFAQLPMALHKSNELLQQMELRVAKDGALVAKPCDAKSPPNWLKHNPDAKSFSGSSIPEGAPDIQPRLKALQGGLEVDEVEFAINKP